MFERDTQTVFTRNCYQQVMVDAATQMVSRLMGAYKLHYLCYHYVCLEPDWLLHY